MRKLLRFRIIIEDLCEGTDDIVDDIISYSEQGVKSKATRMAEYKCRMPLNHRYDWAKTKYGSFTRDFVNYRVTLIRQ